MFFVSVPRYWLYFEKLNHIEVIKFYRIAFNKNGVCTASVNSIAPVIFLRIACFVYSLSSFNITSYGLFRNPSSNLVSFYVIVHLGTF